MSAATFDDGVRTAPAGQDTLDAADGEFHEVVPGTAGPPGMVASAVGYRSARLRPDLHRGLPSPYLTLLFSLDGPLVAGDTAGQAHGPDAVRRDTVVAGLLQSPAYVLQPERQAGIQLAVHPLAARALFGLPAAALGADLFPSGVDVLPQDLAGTAAASGYYDHSHLVRGFRRYTGLGLTSWVAEECRNIQVAGSRHGENRTHGQHIAHPATSRQRLAHAPGP